MANYKIFPYTIINGEKTPLVDWKTEASNDSEKIRQWQIFFKDQIAGWGLPTGSMNGIWALDIDVKNGGNGFDYLKSIGVNQLPYTAFQHTPSGGMHLFFKLSDQRFHPTSVNKETKVDTRGEGGLCWIYQPNFEIPLAEAPDWVWTQVLTKRKKEKQEVTGDLIQLNPMNALEEFNSSINAVLGAGSGERNHTLNTHAYVVGRLVANGALPKDYAYEQLKLAAIKIGLPEREAHATIMSGLTNGQANPHTHPFGSEPPQPAFNIPEAPQVVPRTRWTPQPANLQMLTDWTKLKKPQLFENWATEDIHLTSAIGGVGKTTLKLYEAVCLALGLEFLGFKCLKPGKTLFIVGEDSEAKLYAMVGKMLKQMGLFEPGHEHLVRTVIQSIIIKRADDICLVVQDPRTRNFIPNKEDLEKIFEAIDDIQPVNIVFDPIAMFWGAESGGNDMAMALSKVMQRIQIKSNACVDMITHIGKDSHNRKDVSQFSGRGGTALANHSRVVRTLLKLNEREYREYTGEELPEECTAIYCHVSKFSDGSPVLDKPFIILRNKFLLARKEILEVNQFSSQSEDVEQNKMKIFNYIKSNSSEAKQLNIKAIEAHFDLQKPKIQKTTTRSILTLLENDGLIEYVPNSDPAKTEWVRSAL